MTTAEHVQLPVNGEEQLLVRARSGDRAALEDLIRLYQGRVYRFGMKMCGNAEDARDVVQDTFLSVAKSIGNFRGEGALATWLYKIARSFCTKKRRRSKFAPEKTEPIEEPGRQAIEPADSRLSPEHEIARRELELALNKAIAGLPPAFREVFLLRDLEGLSTEQTAQVLGLQVATVKTRLHRARLAVRKALAPLLGLEESSQGPRTQCPDVALLLSRYLEGELSPSVCAEMERHLDACGRCRDTCASLKQVLALCRSSPEPEVPAELQETIRRRIAELVSR